MRSRDVRSVFSSDSVRLKLEDSCEMLFPEKALMVLYFSFRSNDRILLVQIIPVSAKKRKTPPTTATSTFRRRLLLIKAIKFLICAK